MKNLTISFFVGIVTMWCFVSTTYPQEELIIIEGSSAAEKVVRDIAEKFMEVNPDIRVEVRGGGSALGIKKFKERECDVANISLIGGLTNQFENIRNLSNSEILYLGFCGVRIVVNKNNPLKKLTLDNFKKILLGKVNDWSMLTDKNKGEINIYTRSIEESQGLQFLNFWLLEGAPLISFPLSSNRDILEAVGNDSYGIGIIDVNVDMLPPNVKIVTVEDKNKQEKESLSLILAQLIRKPIPSHIAKFIKFETSSFGAEIIREDGYLPFSFNKELSVNH